MQYNTLLARIAADIYSNGAELITGDLLQNVLNDMVGALASAGACYKGTITPASAAPLDLDQPTVYLALEAGTYTNFVDSNNDPIVTTGPALITYDGGASLVFSKTDLPSGSPDAVLYTPQTLADPQKTQARENIEAAHAVRITNANISEKPYLYIAIPIDSQELNLRIDVVAHNTSGDKIGYTGSLILALNDDGGGVWTGRQAYYYGDDIALLFSSIAIDVYGDYYLVLACESSNDDITLTIYPTTDTEIAATWYASRPGTEESTITPTVIGAGSKRGVISQTQTWTTMPSVNAPGVYAMSNLVMGLIPQANIDLYEAAGATFNTLTGYFELNGLTDISYNEMKDIYAQNVPNPWNGQQGMFAFSNIRTNIPPKNNIATVTAFSGLRLAYNTSSKIERIVLKSNAARVQLNNLQLAFFFLFYMSDSPDEIDVTNATNFAQAFDKCYSLREIRLYKLKASLSFADCSALSKDSLLYMINNSQTSAFTITLHASVYAKTQSGGEWYSDISTALAAHTNVSLASA